MKGERDQKPPRHEESSASAAHELLLTNDPVGLLFREQMPSTERRFLSDRFLGVYDDEGA